MPIYEYACRACGHAFEEWQKMSDAPVRTCPKCKKKKVDKLISQTAFQLKGGGWYADLYSSEPQAGKDGKDGKDGGKDAGKDAAKDSGAVATKEASGGKDAAPAAASEKKDAKREGATAKPDGKKKEPSKKTESRAA